MMAPLEEKLNEQEKIRNSVGHTLVYVHHSHPMASYINISKDRNSLIEVPLNFGNKVIGICNNII